MASSRSGRAASPHAVTALVCALAGYLTESSLQPPPLGLPTIRAFQAAHATITRHWLTERLQRPKHDLSPSYGGSEQESRA